MVYDIRGFRCIMRMSRQCSSIPRHLSCEDSQRARGVLRQDPSHFPSQRLRVWKRDTHPNVTPESYAPKSALLGY